MQLRLRFHYPKRAEICHFSFLNFEAVIRCTCIYDSYVFTKQPFGDLVKHSCILIFCKLTIFLVYHIFFFYLLFAWYIIFTYYLLGMSYLFYSSASNLFASLFLVEIYLVLAFYQSIFSFPKKM